MTNQMIDCAGMHIHIQKPRGLRLNVSIRIDTPTTKRDNGALESSDIEMREEPEN